MAYLFGAYIEKNKNFKKNLEKIYGIGLSKSKIINKILSLNKMKYNNLTDKKKYQVQKLISNNVKTGLLLQKYNSLSIVSPMTSSSLKQGITTDNKDFILKFLFYIFKDSNKVNFNSIL